jgi:hypothetical protein
MNEQLEAASRDDFRWRSLCIALIAGLAFLAWVLTQPRTAPGKLRNVPPVPAKQRSIERATPTGDPLLVCHAGSAHSARPSATAS